MSFNVPPLSGVFFGALCIGMAGVASMMGSVLQVNTKHTRYCSHFLLFSSTVWWMLKSTSQTNTFFLFSGSSVHIWHDKWTPSWSLSIRHVLSHIKLNSEYFLALKLPLAQLYNLTKILPKKHKCDPLKKVVNCSHMYFSGRTCRNDHRSSVDSVGGDRRPDLPTDSWTYEASSTHHCRL